MVDKVVGSGVVVAGEVVGSGVVEVVGSGVVEVVVGSDDVDVVGSGVVEVVVGTGVVEEVGEIGNLGQNPLLMQHSW